MQKDQFEHLIKPQALKDQKWPEGTQPLLCVRTMTFMHEKYIESCLEGVLMQETTFPVKMFVHDDASTDKTREILQKYERAYPQLIKVYYQEENTYQLKRKHGTYHGRRRAFFDWIDAKYVALCEGDDYWTDPTKLQKQVSYLESNPDCSMSFHNVERLNEQTGTRRLFMEQYEKQDYEFADILKHWLVPTCSIVYRREMYELPDWWGNVSNGDYLQQLMLASKGYLHRIEGVMGVYRKHEGGMSQQFRQRSVLLLNLVYMFRMLDMDTGGQYRKEIEEAVDAWVMNSYAADMKQRIEQDFIADLDRLSSQLTPAQVLKMMWLKLRRKVRG
ncbi:MAG: glycosyltransferase [Cryomorphaceae bacterium]|nr:MAG: glycosyltransferase [Cryomorphaceae bacterium]